MHKPVSDGMLSFNIPSYSILLLDPENIYKYTGQTNTELHCFGVDIDVF